MFELMQICLNIFAIVKKEETLNVFPVNVHGFIEVNDFVDDEYYCLEMTGMSQELEESGELEKLQKDAVEITEESIAEEFGD